MGTRVAPKSQLNIRKKIERVILEKHREHFGTGASVRLEATGYRNHLDLFVTSSKFAGMLLTDRTSIVWDWLREGLAAKEHHRIVSTLPLTPAEERRLTGNGH